MTPQATVQYAVRLLTAEGYEVTRLPAKHAEFAVFADFVLDVVRDLPSERKEAYYDLRGFVESLLRLKDIFADELRRDPPLAYTPAHDVALKFHKSLAKWKIFHGGNYIAKTTTGLMEHYFALTHQPIYRPIPTETLSTVLVGVSYQDYAVGVLERKLISGEDDNILAPMFPPGGKWLQNYDRRSFKLTIKCRECAEAGVSCPEYHRGRGELYFFSAEAGSKGMQGMRVFMMHFDEHAPEEFFNEGRQRLVNGQPSYGIVTQTPLYGPDMWENRILIRLANGPADINRVRRDDPKSPPYVERFQIDQYSAGLKSREAIDADKAAMDEFEIQARVYGNYVALGNITIFDRAIVQHQYEQEIEWTRSSLNVFDGVALKDAIYQTDVYVSDDPVGKVEIRERPEEGSIYVIGVDVAAGLDPGDSKVGRDPDASCATVYKLSPTSDIFPRLTQVAVVHGHFSHLEYAMEIKKLGLWYNLATVIVETTGGHGQAILEHLRVTVPYPNLFRDRSSAEVMEMHPSGRLGFDTTKSTKPVLVHCGKDMFNGGFVDVGHKPTLDELLAFTQTKSGSGNVRFGAVTGAHDDRVISMLLCCYAVMSNSSFTSESLRMMQNSPMRFQGPRRSIKRDPLRYLPVPEETKHVDW